MVMPSRKTALTNILQVTQRARRFALEDDPKLAILSPRPGEPGPDHPARSVMTHAVDERTICWQKGKQLPSS